MHRLKQAITAVVASERDYHFGYVTLETSTNKLWWGFAKPRRDTCFGLASIRLSPILAGARLADLDPASLRLEKDEIEIYCKSGKPNCFEEWAVDECPGTLSTTNDEYVQILSKQTPDGTPLSFMRRFSGLDLPTTGDPEGALVVIQLLRELLPGGTPKIPGSNNSTTLDWMVGSWHALTHVALARSKTDSFADQNLAVEWQFDASLHRSSPQLLGGTLTVKSYIIYSHYSGNGRFDHLNKALEVQQFSISADEASTDGMALRGEEVPPCQGSCKKGSADVKRTSETEFYLDYRALSHSVNDALASVRFTKKQ